MKKIILLATFLLISIASKAQDNSITLEPNILSGFRFMKNIYFYNGRVGIGSQFPDRAMFEIKNVEQSKYAISVYSSPSYDIGRVAEFNTLDYIQGIQGSSFSILLGSSTGNTFSELRAQINGKLGFGNLILQSSGGNVGIGTTNPTSKLQVSNGDIYVNNPNYGIILKSQNGQCWRVGINDDGSFKSTSITCP